MTTKDETAIARLHPRACAGCRAFFDKGIRFQTNPHTGEVREIAQGECRLDPPRAGHGWPGVRSGDWCLQFEAGDA